MKMRSVPVLATLVSVCVTLALAAAPSSGAASSSYVTNGSFKSNTSGWSPGAQDKVSRVRYSNGVTAGHLSSSAKGTKTISMTSTVGTRKMPTVGSRAHTAAYVRTSVKNKPIYYRIEEISKGKVVTSHTSRNVAKSTGWFWVGAELKTKVANSQVRVTAYMPNITGTHYLRIRNVSVDVTPPKVTPTPTPTPKPTSPAPTTPAPTTPAPTKCEDINYKDPAQGDLTFVDDFNGTTLNKNNWRVRDNTFLNQDAAFISKDNVSVHDGYLDIMGKREPESKWRTNNTALYGAENATRKYSTGYVDSIKKKTYESADDANSNRFSQKYGHFEARMWVPSAATMSRGIWPAFWLRGDAQPGEIDPMESYGGPTIRSFDPSSSYEWNSWGDTAAGSQSNNASQQTHGRANVGTDKIWQGWHTYAVNWSPDCLRYIYDGKTVGFIDFNDPATKPYFKGKTFDDTFHIRFNMQVGSKYWGWPDQEHTRDEFNFKIDHVKVYQGK